MVSELGLDAAEARLEEATEVIAPKTDAANEIDLKLFIGEAVARTAVRIRYRLRELCIRTA
jgi:hypothetical protein